MIRCVIMAGAGPAGLLGALHARCFPPAEAWDEAAIGSLLTMPGCFACVLEAPEPDEMAPAGMTLARVAADEAELLTIGMTPSARRQGLATRMMRQVMTEAAGRGAKRLFLEVSVNNAAALPLYRRLRFVEVGRRRHYYSDHSDALILAVDLGDIGPPLSVA